MINIYEKCKLCRELSERCVEWIARRASKCCCANEAGANLHTTLISWILITLHYGHCQLHSLFLLYILGKKNFFTVGLSWRSWQQVREGARGDKWEKGIGRARAVFSTGSAVLYWASYSCRSYLSVGIFSVLALVCKYLKKRSLRCSGFYSAFVWGERQLWMLTETMLERTGAAVSGEWD